MLYVGKAKHLKHRIKSYQQVKTLPNHKRQLVTQAAKLKYQILDSELKALLTEAELIRTYQPPFNILLKDDKSPLYIQVTKEKYPRVLQVRKNQLTATPKATTLGPFNSGYRVKQVLEIARRIFPWCNQANHPQGKACFYHHIELCSGACFNQVTPKEYTAMIKNLTLFLKGQSTQLISQLKKTMQAEVKKENFEKATKIRDTLEAIIYVTKDSYKLKPELQTLSLAGDQTENKLKYLSRLLKLHLAIPPFYPLKRIEGYDVSNIQGKAAAVAMVVFINGQHQVAEGRLFNIKTLQTPNDYQMLQEVLIRRQNHPEWSLPSLLVIDGGKGQVRAALKVWRLAKIPIIGIAKNPDRLVFPIRTNSQGKDCITWRVVQLDDSHPGLMLIQEIRDQAHRLSKKQHHKLKARSFFS